MRFRFRPAALGSSALLMIVFSGCRVFTPDLATRAQTNPEWCLAHADSLLQASRDREETAGILAGIYRDRARAAYATEAWEQAAEGYHRASELQPGERAARYGEALSRGRLFYQRGGPNDLWEAIVNFGAAAALDTTDGLAWYWLACSYEKKDENDFELILEAYDKALAQYLPGDLEQAARAARAEVASRRKLYQEFWK